jgi:hypothetical protein
MNLLSPYLFVRDLLAGPGRTRVVVVGTSLLRRARPDDDPQALRHYRGLDVYGRTKLYGAAALLELAARRDDLSLVVADPGGASTEMTAGMTPRSVPWAMKLAWPLFRAVQSRMTPATAAVSTVAAATDPGMPDGAWVTRKGATAALPAVLQDRALRDRSLRLAEGLIEPTAQSRAAWDAS